MIVLGVDPGSRVTGYGVVRREGGRLTHVAHGQVRCAQGSPPERLLMIYRALAQVVAEYKPDAAAVETVYVNRNVQSALVLGQARGAAICALAGSGMTVHEYSPAQVKMGVVGSGRAEKQQVQHMVKVLLNLRELPPVDAADALAVALCHAQVSATRLHAGAALGSHWGRA